MGIVVGESIDGVPAVKGTATGAAPSIGVEGESAAGWGVHGHSTSGRGVVATSDGDYGLRAHSRASAGLRSSSDDGRGVEGWSTRAEGVHGISESGNGVWGHTKSGTGVVGTSDLGHGGSFETRGGEGVRGISVDGIGVHGHSNHSVGVSGVSVDHEGVHAESGSTSTAALAAYQTNPASGTAALFAKHAGNGAAAVFEGNVIVSGDIVLTNADCAEDFDIATQETASPGTVMTIDDEGNLRESCEPYDRRVTGVLSGAGGYRPGLILDKQQSSTNRKPVALMGKVFCKVDAAFGAIAVGDLLTTSSTPGHAMRAEDASRAFGAVPLTAGTPSMDSPTTIPICHALHSPL